MSVSVKKNYGCCCLFWVSINIWNNKCLKEKGGRTYAGFYCQTAFPALAHYNIQSGRNNKFLRECVLSHIIIEIFWPARIDDFIFRFQLREKFVLRMGRAVITSELHVFKSLFFQCLWPVMNYVDGHKASCVWFFISIYALFEGSFLSFLISTIIYNISSLSILLS